jgi:hypothetical protein
MFDSPLGKQWDTMGEGGAPAFFREEALKAGSTTGGNYAVTSRDVIGPARCLVAGVGCMYFEQLAPYKRSERGPLETGFMNLAETVVFGNPEFMLTSAVYAVGTRSLQYGNQRWELLVKRRMTNRKATPVDELLRMGSSTMSEANYAEGWTLVELLNKQPVKFGKLLMELSPSGSEMAAIEKVYGWDEKKLTQEWRKYVLAERSKGAEKSR